MAAATEIPSTLAVSFMGHCNLVKLDNLPECWSQLCDRVSQNRPYEIAEVYAFRNQPDEAFEWLNRAYDQRASGLITAKVDPLLNSLHNDPRFAALLKKLNLSA